MSNVALQTVTPAFSNDIMDIVRVFLHGATLVYEGESEIFLRHTEETQENHVLVTILIHGAKTVIAKETYTPNDDPLLHKRFQKRAIKLAVYSGLKELTGHTPPWGALTGIRPTAIVRRLVKEGLSLPNACQKAKETYDITEEKTALLQEIMTTQQALPLPKAHQVDVYVGIPFCVSRCAYCSFLSGEIGKGKDVAPYVQSLLKEIQAAKTLIAQKNLEIDTVYIGGGTPTALPAHLLQLVLQAVAPLAKGKEFTVEAGRPDTIDLEKLTMIKAFGANRISINPQTVHDKTLRKIGRAHTHQQTIEAYEMARSLGFSHINMDLIAGLPGEDEAMFAETLQFAKAMRPESLTVHTLCIKRSSLLNLWQSSLPDGDRVQTMVRMGYDVAKELHMPAYYLYRQKNMAGNLENVGYATPGHACRYNINMMEELGNVLALGAGGISKRVYDMQGKIKRAPNVSNIQEYINRTDEMIERKYTLWTGEEAPLH